MKKLTKILYISIATSLLITLAIIVLPNSINNYYSNPEIYDTGFSYYLWKFRPIDASSIARITSWSFFFLHLVSVMVLLRKSKLDKQRIDGISKYNIQLLFANLFFVILHYVHTWIWYDALAQDTPVWSSQGSVIIMLVLILIMENSRRGLFFGKKIPFPKESVRTIMKSHGAFISLAVIFTFWYHPMEFTWGHMFGVFYLLLLMIQMSLSRTKVHNNKYWNAVLEVLVLFHGTFVALQSNNELWAMFLFGFAAIFFITQIYGLGLSKKKILVSQIGFLIITLIVYSGLFSNRSLGNIEEVFRIPIIEYLLVFAIVFAIYLPIWVNKKVDVPKWVNKTLAISLTVIVLLVGVMIIFAQNPYQAEVEMYENIHLNAGVVKTDERKAIVFEPATYEYNIVFVPGGKVVPASYSYLASELANNGIKVTIIKPLLNLAIFSPNQASKFIEEDKINVVMGHSLGGVVASMIASKTDEFEYLIIMGSYNTSPITEEETLAITSEHDSLDLEKYNAAMATVSNLTEEYIPGGNHAYFGYYGNQKGDGEAEMTNKEQQDIVVDIIISYLLD